MRPQDYERLMAVDGYFYRGGLPELGKPHAKAGYRWCVGLARYSDGKVQSWRENLGHDKLLAQYRAKEMTDLWAVHVQDQMVFAGVTDPALIEIPPLDREQAKREAWEEAAEAMAAPAKRAEEITAELKGQALGQTGPAVSPGFRLVAVPDHASSIEADEIVAQEMTARGAVSGKVMLHRAGEMWMVALRQRLEANDISDSYVERAEATIRRFKKIVPDVVVAEMTKPQLDLIRLRIQAQRKKNGQLQKRGTVRTDLGNIRTFFEWLVECEMWSPRERWEKWLRPVFRQDERDDDADESGKVVRYTFAELKKIYASAPPSTRLWILLALNFSWGAKEIDTARRGHFKPDKQRVARFRHKRGPNAEPIPGRWTAWPETWTLAMERMAKTPGAADDSNAIALLTRTGQRLVRYQRGRRYDVPADALKEACEKAGVKYRGFYALRRSAIGFVKRVGKKIDGEAHGKLMADLFSQHGKRDMTQRYLPKEWRELFKILRSVRRKLQPMFDAPQAADA